MQPIERVSQTDMVVKELTKYFLSDAISEGDKLPTEMELCERLRVGRSTVREALKALQVMGYVSMEPGRGAFLKRKNLETPVHRILSWLGNRKVELAEVLEVRMELESLSIQLAVERGSDEEIEKIEAVRKEYESTLLSGKFSVSIGDALGELDAKFHALIGEASHNTLLIYLNTMVTEAFRKYRSRTFRVESHAKNAVIPHRKIVEALKMRDGVLARRFMKNHLYKALNDMSLGTGE